MRALAIDHYFGQDLGALRASSGSNRLWDIGFPPLLKLARQHFPDEVFTGIEPFFRPDYADARASYALDAAAWVDDLLRTYRFDLLLAPSDTFFWIRAVIERCHQLGIPVVILQKEATIPPGWSEGPAREWGETSPFLADHMLVSSEHHRRFWMASGVDGDRIEVTGQPRFDIYVQPDARQSWLELGVRVSLGPTVLFLTYDENAYMPMIDRTGLAPWRELRDQTEQVLCDHARQGRVNVLIKAHPQPAEDQSTHLDELSSQPGVQVLDPLGDVRRYLLAADIVVGFQSTALFEALAAGRPTLYTWWTDAVEVYGDSLIPFHKHAEALSVVRSPESLASELERLSASTRSQTDAARIRRDAEPLINRFIGPVDGRAASRCWASMTRVASNAQPTQEARDIAAEGRKRRRRVYVRAASSEVAWAAAGRLPYRAYRWLARNALRRPAIMDEGAFRETTRRERLDARSRRQAAA